MKDWISCSPTYAVVAIDAMAVLIIAIGTIEMFVACVRSVFDPSRTGRDLRDGYLRYARWLMAGLTFQLANDIIISARAPSWDDIGRLAAIAFIRTFLNFFLERDIREAGGFRWARSRRAPADADLMRAVTPPFAPLAGSRWREGRMRAAPNPAGDAA